MVQRALAIACTGLTELRITAPPFSEDGQRFSDVSIFIGESSGGDKIPFPGFDFLFFDITSLRGYDFPFSIAARIQIPTDKIRACLADRAADGHVHRGG